jgi:hypothetical protein
MEVTSEEQGSWKVCKRRGQEARQAFYTGEYPAEGVQDTARFE